MHYVVLGAGAAGIAALRAIHREEPSAKLTCITTEPAPFYFRPMLVELFARSAFNHDAGKVPIGLEAVDWHFGARVMTIAPKENVVKLATGEAITYDFLIIATGSKADLSFVEPFREVVNVLHSYSDLIRLKKNLQFGEVLVIGGGYVAIEIIRQLHNRGNSVTYFARPDYFWPREVPGVTASDIEQILTGVAVPPQFDNEVVDVVDWNGTQYSVIDKKGQRHMVDVILAIPVETPNIGLLKGSGIRCEEGVIVNEELRTNIPNIFAAGDCAQVLDLKHQINRVNFGWRSAEKQGELAGQNAVGKNVVYVPSSQDFYFLDLLGKSLLDRWAGPEQSINS
ncbi:MAG: NAD(P)/FAD-dependent oxidoreductase [bacterium]|nr:NAD(P)/FAD-dependent oxidoreductase [bacterium]